jgi:parvulin-like peptidyl-prolyl isomerase
MESGGPLRFNHVTPALQHCKTGSETVFWKEPRIDAGVFLWYSLDRSAMRDFSCKAFHTKNVRQALISAVLILILLVCFSSTGLAAVIDGIAIIVNKDVILVSEVNEAMMPLIQEFRARYAGAELKKRMAELRDTIIEQAIDTKLILQVAKKNGITASDKTIDTRIEAVRERFPSEDNFLQALEVKGITYREYREQVAEQVLAQETIRRVLGTEISVLDNELLEYYDGHPDEFVTEARVNLAQIFVEIPSGSNQEELKQLRQKLEQVRILTEDGADFSELAMKYSEGPFREKGGTIGVVSSRDILPELEETAFSLKAGEVSQVKQSTYGFHLLKALELMPARKIEFEEAKLFIEERLSETKRSEKYEEWIKKLKEDSFIEIKI